MRACSCMRSSDSDDLCSYTTFKTVSVRHKWLGLVYYSTILLINIPTTSWSILNLSLIHISEPTRLLRLADGGV